MTAGCVSPALTVSSGLILAARLKALGIDYVIIDENENYGDNWAKRYDFMRFHVPKGSAKHLICVSALNQLPGACSGWLI